MSYRALASVAGIIMLAGSTMGQKKVSQKEYQAWMAIQNAATPDARIEAVDKFVTGFADSSLKSMALLTAAQASEQKRDTPKAIAYAESAMEADPKNYQAMQLISAELARGTRENDLDKEEKLAKAEKLAKDSLPLIASAAKPNAQMPDTQWAEIKKDDTAQSHVDLGMIAIVRKKYDVAIEEYKTAIDTAATPDAATMVRLAGAYNQAGKPDDAAAAADKVLAMPNLNPAVKQFATAEKTRAEQAKNKK